MPLQEPRQLKQDRGDYFRDPNAAKYPTYPIEPAIRTVLAESSDLPNTKIDLFACRSTVGNLLRFVRAVDKPFRFDVEVAGNTVFFIRKEKSPTELIPGVHGYGYTFPESYTTWERDVKSSENSQRLITYDFNGLRRIIRFESDGYFTNIVSKAPSDQYDPLVQKTKDETDLTVNVSVGGH